MLHTHVGCSRQVGYIHHGKLYGHADYRGRFHALVGSENVYTGGRYQSLCGESVIADHDGETFNVVPAVGAVVSCKRCLRILEK